MITARLRKTFKGTAVYLVLSVILW